jgi:hypothetical protein
MTAFQHREHREQGAQLESLNTAFAYQLYCMLPTPPASQVSAVALHDRMNDPAENQNVINTETQQGSKRQRSNIKDNSTRNQHRRNSFVERQSESIHRSDQDMNVFTTIDVTYDNGQGTNDKSIDQYDQDIDTNTTAASEYANVQSIADRRSRQLQIDSTQGNEDVAYDTDEDQTHAMEEDLDQDQGDDHCTSMVYSNGQITNIFSRNQCRNRIKKIKRLARMKKNKAHKKKEEQSEKCLQTHN